MSTLDKKYLIKLDTKSSLFNPTPQFSLSDNETSDFNIRVTNNNKIINLKDIIIVMVAVDPNGIMHSDFVEIEKAEEGLVYCNLSQSLKNVEGTWNARLMCVYNDERIVTSTFSYRVNTDEFVQLNQEVSQDDRFGTLNDMLSRLSTIEITEQTRIDNENSRVEAEKQREIIKQKLINDIEKLVLDTNKKVTENLQENSNKVTKLIEDTESKIDNYKTEKDLSISNDLNDYKEKTTQDINRYKSEKDTQINSNLNDYKLNTTRDLESFKNTKNEELDNYKSAKDTEIDEYVDSKNKEIDNYVLSKNIELDNYKNAKDLLINSKIQEVNTAKNELTETVNIKVSEADERIQELKRFEPQLQQIEEVNTNQNTRLDNVEYANKRQDVMLGGLFNENADGRLNIDGTGNDVKLEGSKDGLVEVNKVVGNTMVNVCDQKDPVAITKSYTVESGNHVALQGEYDGKCRPVVYGNTLVNLYNVRKVEATGGVKVVDNKITVRTTTGRWNNFFYRDKTLFKPNTEYTIILDIIKNTLSENDSIFISSYASDNDKDIFTISNQNTVIHGGNTGLKKIKRTTRSDINNCNMALRSYVDNTSLVAGNELEMSIIILEGDYTKKPIPSCFEGMQSSFEDKVVTQEMVDSGKELAENLGKYKVDYKVTGKNKIPFVEQGDISSTGVNVNSPTVSRTGFIPVKYGIDYVFSSNTLTSSEWHKVFHYDKNKKFITMGYSYQPNSNDGYIRIVFQNKNQDNWTPQYEEGAQATPYEPYKEYTKTYYLNSPLLEEDTIEQQGNNVVHVHRYKEVVFDGSEDEKWVQISNDYIPTNTDYMIYTIVVNDCKIQGNVICKNIPVPLRKYISADYPNAFSIGGHTTNQQLRVCIEKSKLSSVDATGFKTWLQSNPVTVVYELASPTYELISTNDTILTDSYVNGHLDFDTAVPVEKVEFKHFGKEMKYVYPSTNYIIQFESDNDGKLDGIYLSDGNVKNVLITKGVNKIAITTPSNIVHNFLDIQGIGFNASNIVVTESVDEDFGYFEGLKSCFEDGLVTQDMVDSGEELAENLGKYKAEIKVVGKNKFDKDNVIYESNKTINNNDGSVYGGNDIVTDFIVNNLIEGKNYSISSNIVSYDKIVFYDYNKQFIARYEFNSSPGTFVVPNGSKYYRLSMYPSNGADIKTIQLEEGTQVTPYEPYKEHVQTLYLDEPLYHDNELCVHDGKLGYWKKFEKVVLDGSENGWNLMKDNGNNITFLLKNDLVADAYRNPPCISNLFIQDMSQGLIKADNSMRITEYSGKQRLYLVPTKDKCSDLQSFKQWLSNNLVIVVYQLAEPVFVPILVNTPQWVLESFNDCSIHFNSNIPITSSNLSYTGNVPSVYGMEKSISDIEDHNVDMVATTFDMDYRLLEVEWALEDAGITGINLASTFNINRKGERAMALSRYEQAKIMILGGAYDKETLTRQLTRYLEKKLITQSEYDELISLMEAKELVTGE